MRPEVNGDVALAASGDVIVVVWSGAMTHVHWRWYLDALKHAATLNASGVMALHLILPSSTPPAAPLRAQIQRDLREVGPALRHMIVAPLGTSIWVSLVRTIVRAVLVISGHASHLSLVSNVDEMLSAARQASSPRTPSADELKLILSELHRALGIPTAQAA